MAGGIDLFGDDVDSVRSLVAAVAKIAGRNAAAIHKLTEQVDRVVATQETNAIAIDRLTHRIDRLSQSVARLSVGAEADRSVMRGIQTDNQEILNHLKGKP
ncbi:hypothetical protein [Leptolyngbya sp. CCY15150]|uniref:hypothetical protein n=1 Tax=Leptolyngbya sp. CCY15150 TaxID=2767772 RepID=UPI00195110C5|nr:hypothetical protein [Leptolyngbya sp. CCY15150]